MARGHIRPHGDGKWRLYAYAGTDPATGKERRVTKVVPGSRKDAERELTALLGQIDGGHHGTSGGRTLGQLVDAFITHKTLRLEASSTETLRRSAAYITDRYRAMPAAKVTTEDLEALYVHLLLKGRKVVPKTGPNKGSTRLDPATVKNVHACLHGAFEHGRRLKWVTVNPAADAEPPSIPRRLPSPAPADAIPLLLAAAAEEHHALPTYLQVTICAGGRRSEIHGVRWTGIDFIRGVVVLRETVVRGSGGWQVKPYTKSGGQRTIHLDPHTLARLQALHDRAFTDALACDLALTTTAFVFSDSPVGDEPWNPNTTARRFKRACEAAGLPPTTRLHDLRHLMATYLIDQGVPIPVVSARLGHAQNSTTLDIYTGRIAASDAAAAEVMGHLFTNDT